MEKAAWNIFGDSYRYRKNTMNINVKKWKVKKRIKTQTARAWLMKCSI